MADLFPVAGERIYIGGALSARKADLVAADFTAALASAVEIDGWETCGPLGDAAQEITTDLINRGRTVVQKATHPCIWRDGRCRRFHKRHLQCAEAFG